MASRLVGSTELLQWARVTFSSVSLISTAPHCPINLFLLFLEGANGDAILKQPISIVCLMAGLWGNGAGAYDYVAMGSSLSNFPRYKGTAVALNVSHFCFLFCISIRCNFYLHKKYLHFRKLCLDYQAQ